MAHHCKHGAQDEDMDNTYGKEALMISEFQLSWKIEDKEQLIHREQYYESETDVVKEVKEIYYSCESFPHFQYVYRLIRQFAHESCEEKLVKSQVDYSIFHHECPQIKLRVSGDTRKENLRLLSKRKGILLSGNKSTWKNHGKFWEASVHVFFEFKCDQQAPLPFEGLHASSLNQVVYVKHACERELESPPTYVHITEHRKDSVREAITKCLEAPLCSFLKHIRKIFDISEADSRLVEEATSLIKLLKRWDTDFNIPVSQNQQPNYKHGVPREIYDHLSRRRGVNAFGLWRNGNLKVFVEDAMLVDALEAELENIDGVFFRKTKLKILANNITFNICLKQGDEIFRKNDNTTHSSNLGESTSHATIGAFVRNKETFEDIYILTCGHVFPCLDMPAYGKLKEPSVSCKIGSCIFTNPSGIHNFIDFSVVKVDSDEVIQKNCELAFMRSEKQKCNAAVYTESLENTMDYVHKKGATTGWTDGRIQCYSFVVKRFGNRDDVFLVLGKGGKFCEPGDSGSIVFAPDNSVDQENVHILGMLMGTVRSLNADDDNDSETTPEATQDKDSRLEERPEEVSEDSEGAFASLGSFDQGDDDNLRRLSRDELAVCFRMDSALNLLKEKKNLEVEFEKVSMSSDESDLF